MLSHLLPLKTELLTMSSLIERLFRLLFKYLLKAATYTVVNGLRLADYKDFILDHKIFLNGDLMGRL